MKQMQAMGQVVVDPNATDQKRLKALITSAEFLRNEIPIRVAKLVNYLHRFPFELYHNPEIDAIAQVCKKTFADFIAFKEIKTKEDEIKFLNVCKKTLRIHGSMYYDFSKGLAGENLTLDEMKMVQPAIDRFHMGRIGTRMLLSHYVAVHEKRPGWIGVIEKKCDISQVIQEVYSDIIRIFDQQSNTHSPIPLLELKGKAEKFTYVPAHLQYILFELLSNSVRAVNREWKDRKRQIPPIKVIISDGKEDVVIKISDRGGGMDRSSVHNIWTYLFSPICYKNSELILKKIEESNRSAIEIFGRHGPLLTDADRHIFGFAGAFGLPICRLYAQYFGGDIKLFSMEGHGTDVYVYLRKLGNYPELSSNIPAVDTYEGNSDAKNTWTSKY